MPTNSASRGMIILAWCVPVQPVADASQAGGEPCPDIAGCPLPGAARAPGDVCESSSSTRRAAVRSVLSCYIRAVTPCKAKLWTRTSSYRLYVAAAGALSARVRFMAEARGWRLRAADRVAICRGIFREEPAATCLPSGANVREGDWDAEAAAAGLWAQIGTRQLRAGATLYSAGSVEDGLRCVRMAVRLLMQGANRGEDSQEGWTALMTLGEMLQGQGRDAEAIPWLAWAVRVLRVEGTQSRAGKLAGRVSKALGKLTRRQRGAACRLRTPWRRSRRAGTARRRRRGWCLCCSGSAAERCGGRGGAACAGHLCRCAPGPAVGCGSGGVRARFAPRPGDGAGGGGGRALGRRGIAARTCGC